jgi:putative membrane protein
MSYIRFLLAVFVLTFIWSLIGPHDYFTWWLEVFPAVIGFVILIVTYKRFPLTHFLYTLILIHAVILMIGGHYTYAEVPLFDWIRDFFGGARNNYDKVGHFAQGFVPFFIAREVLIRKSVVSLGWWLGFILVCICMALSASYELLEWFVSVVSGSSGDSFLGTQGYVWDTQSDMLYATIGALVALMFFTRFHDRALAQLNQVKR